MRVRVQIAVVGNLMQKRWKECEGVYVTLEEIRDVGDADMWFSLQFGG